MITVPCVVCQSANAVLERAADTIQDLRAQNDRLLVQGGDQLQGGCFHFLASFQNSGIWYVEL